MTILDSFGERASKQSMITLPQNEPPVVWKLFIYSLTISTSYIVARTVGDSLFLSRIGNDELALVFVLAGITTAIVASSWYLLTRRVSVARSIQLSGLVFASFSCLAWGILPSYHHSFWLLAIIYMATEIKGCINAINIVSALNSKFGRQAKKSSWALVGLAAPLAGVMVGGFLAYESSVISLRNWLLIGAVLDVISVGIGFVIEKAERITEDAQIPLRDRKSAAPVKSKKPYVCSDQFRFWIGILISAKVVVLTFVAFEWKSMVNSFFSGNPERLLQFFGIYYGFVGVATVTIQFFLTGTLLTRRKLALPLLLMPVVLFAVGIALVSGVGLLMGLFVSTLGKSQEVWRRSVHDTTLNTLYTKIQRSQRRSAIAFNSALVKPISEVLASCIILFGAAVVYRQALVLAVVIWIVAAIRLLRLVQTPTAPELGGKPDVSHAIFERTGDMPHCDSVRVQLH